MRPGPRPHPRLGPRAFISQPFVPIAHDCCVHFHAERDPAHAHHAHDWDRAPERERDERDHERDSAHGQEHEHDCERARDHARDHEHDCEHDRDRERLKPVRKIAAFISQYQAGVCLPATRKRPQ